MAVKPATYHGSERLKGKNVAIEWTPELLEEMRHCIEDPVYFAAKYMKVVTPDGELINLNLYDYQKEILQSCQEYRRTIVVTSRQAGKTTTATALILHHVLFNPFRRVMILSQDESGAKDVLERIKLAYEYLPQWLQQGILAWNEGDIKLENGSTIKALATRSKSARGKSVSLLYIDEAAHIDDWEKFHSAVFPVLSAGKKTKVLMTSTPNGLNHYYKLWENANKDHNSVEWNSYNPIMVSWERVPGRDEAWKLHELAGMDFNYDKFAQEYEGEFLGTSGTLISSSKLRMMKPEEPKIVTAGLRIYEEPQDKHAYMMVCDVSRGKGKDYHAFSVIDVTESPYRQVATYRENAITTVDYAAVINKIAIYYKRAYVLVEINDIGGQVADLLWMDHEYENLLWSGPKAIAMGPTSTAKDRGLRTTTSVKSIGCSMLKMLVENNKLLIPDYNTIQELARFSKKGKTGNQYEAIEGNDDLVMGLVIFAYLTSHTFFEDLTSSLVSDALRFNGDEAFADFVGIEEYEKKTEDEFVGPGLDSFSVGWF